MEGADVVGQTFINCLSRRDFAGLEALLDDEVRIRALTPNETWGHHGSAMATAMLANWFGNEQLELVASRVNLIEDRTHLSYRFNAFNGTTWRTIEQQAYCITDQDKIKEIAIICSGFRPITGQLPL